MTPAVETATTKPMGGIVKGRFMKKIALWAILGSIYMLIEGVFRLFFGNGGWVHISMFAVGGLCGVAVGSINQSERFYKLPVFVQALIGAGIVLVVEFLAGCILNLWLGLGIWDYSALPGNIMGQICPYFAAAWFAIMPFAIWLEDRICWRLWGEGVFYTLKSIYVEWITGK